jgi:short-subunit dehydrogenase
VSKVVLITGASSGIGYAAALEFAKRGDNVAATARRADRLQALQQAAQGLPGKILPITADVLSAADMQRAVAETLAAFGRLDVLVANAGLGQRGPLVESPWEDIADVLHTNVEGMLHSVRAGVPAMRQTGGGSIVMISSISGVVITPFATTYAASKAAMNAFGRGLRQELSADHIWVTNMLVGQTETEFSAKRRGKPGKLAAPLSSMKVEKVARDVVRAADGRRRAMVLRPLDMLLVFGGMFLPALMDRLAARAYHQG